MKIITVAQGKGGVGKTTIAVNIAGELSRRNYNVALVDSDPQGSACQWAEPGNLEFPVYEIGLENSSGQYGPAAAPMSRISPYVISP